MNDNTELILVSYDPDKPLRVILEGSIIYNEVDRMDTLLTLIEKSKSI